MARRLSSLFIIVLFLSCVSISFAGDSISAKVRMQQIGTGFSCGLKAEMNMYDLIHWGRENMSSGMRFGASLGGFANFRLSRVFSIQADFLLHYKNTYIEENSTRGYLQYFGSEIPLYVMYHLKLKKSKGIFSFGVGPFTEFGFKSTIRSNGEKYDLYEIDSDTHSSAFKDSNSGFAFLVGYEFRCGLQLNVSYKISVSNLLDTQNSDYAFRPQTLAVGVAYRFGKEK